MMVSRSVDGLTMMFVELDAVGICIDKFMGSTP
jgi:hypothetical protein